MTEVVDINADLAVREKQFLKNYPKKSKNPYLYSIGMRSF